MADGRPVTGQAPSDAAGAVPGERAAPVPGRGTPAGLPVGLQGGPPFDQRLEELERHRAIDVAGRTGRARRLEVEAQAAGDVLAAMRARLVVADMLNRSGDPAGVRLAVEVNDWAAAHGARRLLARSHLVLSDVFEWIGDGASALDHAVRAMDLVDDDTPDRDRGNQLMQLADALEVIGSVDEARRRYLEAEQVFSALGDRERQVAVLNNLAVLEQNADRVEAALDVVARLTRLSGADDLRPAMADTIARVHLMAGDLRAAELAVERGHRMWATSRDDEFGVMGTLALTGAEVLLAQGRFEEAGSALQGCLRICAERDLAGVRVLALQARAALLAAQGDFEGAYRAHQAFHAEHVVARSSEQEAAARTRQTLFETAEARRKAERFWRQARTDALTELYNRRFIDEQLPRYLADVAGRGGCVAVAIVDADHFKRVNDRFSHAVGDQVLRLLAARLGTALRPVPAAGAADGDHPDFAARLGGEEFLVVAARPVPPDAPPGTLERITADVVQRLTSIRADVAALPWHDLAEGLAVTVSVGIAVAAPGESLGALLARADAHLYRAKELGRDRVVTDAPAAATAP